MKRYITTPVLLVTLALAGSLSVHAGTIVTGGTGEMGLNNSGSYGSEGIIYNQQQQYPATSLTDGDVDTGVTTYAQTNNPSFLDNMGNELTSSTNSSFAQLTFTSLKSVSSLDVTFKIYVDGGWLGSSGSATAASPLAASELTVPVLQVTLDGTNWTDVSTSDYTDNYLSVLTGAYGNQTFTNDVHNIKTVSFTLFSAESIEGIRVIGTNGGNGGFVGTQELVASVPEPSTYGMLLGGVALLFVMKKLRKSVSV